MLPQQYVELAKLAGGFIHEVKNHLSTFGLHLQMLEEDFSDPQTQRERRALERIQRLRGECKRLEDVSNDFLRFARAGDLELQPVNLAEVIDAQLDFFMPTALTKGIEVRAYLPADLPSVSLDRQLFGLALLNLLLNSEQAMPEGGELTLQATAEPGAVVLSVIDTGKGMPPEVLARAFEPFFSTRTGGTGLGLATTRKIIEAHGGSIAAESEVGRGTKFTIRLPVAGA